MANFSAPTHMAHQFSQVPKAVIPRSRFDRSHGRKMTFNAADLNVCFLDEVLPGDTFSLNMKCFARLSTPIYPIMDNVFLETFFFFVPCRLVWAHWEHFNGFQQNPGDSTSYILPTVPLPIGGVANGSLYEQMGVPPFNQIAAYSINNLPARCYNLIYNEWFRDQNLKTSRTETTGDGPDTYSSFSTLAKRGKRHDYFTSCLPWPQKGTAVSLPLGTSAPVIGTGKAMGLSDGTNTFGLYSSATNVTGSAQGSAGLNIGSAAVLTGLQPASTVMGLSTVGANTQVIADLTNATAATINQLRQSFQIQKLYERDARGGTRYTEVIRAHFGVTSPDARLQRPEYLGGGSSRIIISSVAQTSGTGASGTTTPIGTLSAFGTAMADNHGFSKSFVEHGYILGIVNVRADITYQYGLNKLFTRSTRLDFYWPSLAHIGEQPVLQGEIYFQGAAADATVFGYQERFAEYRYKPSDITGQFRSSYSTPLDAWHLGDKYTSAPTLGSTWIDDQPPMSRVKAVTSSPDVLADFFFQLNCARPMPLYGVPSNIDRF